MPCHRKQSFRDIKIIENFYISTHEIMSAANNVRIFPIPVELSYSCHSYRLCSESDMLLIILILILSCVKLLGNVENILALPPPPPPTAT